MTEGYLFYITLGVIAIIAIQFFRGGHIMLALATLAVGGWIYYNHDKNIDISEEIYQSIDEGAKSEYEDRNFGQRDLGTYKDQVK